MPVAGGARFSHIPLTLFYSSLTKLFLLFCLSIWRPDVAASTHRDAGPLTPLHPSAAAFPHTLVARALALLDEDTLDREWVVRNVLGGMAAGFGLRGVYVITITSLRPFPTDPCIPTAKAPGLITGGAGSERLRACFMGSGMRIFLIVVLTGLC